MMQREGASHYDLLLDIKRIDQRRGHSLSNHHNELAKAIGYESN